MFCPSAMHDGSPFWRPGAFGALTTTNTGPQLAFGASESKRTLDRRVAGWKLRFLFLTTRWSGKKGAFVWKQIGKVWLKHVENTFVAVTGGDVANLLPSSHTLWKLENCMGFHLLMWRYVENLRRQSLHWMGCFSRWKLHLFCLLSMLACCWACGIYNIHIQSYICMLSIVKEKTDEAPKRWVGIIMFLFALTCQICTFSGASFLEWALGGFHRIASSEDIPRQGPHPSGTLENNRLCPLTDCWQHASHFLKHLESCLQKTIKLRQREANMGV